MRGFVVKGDRDRWTYRSGRKPLLECLDVELTERCDSDCIHCCINLPAGDPRARALELPTGEWMRIFRKAAELGALTIRMTGGEPLLRDDFAELYLYARRLGLKVLLFTNARRITPGLADLLARVPPLERIEVTVYGMRAETYEAVTRVPGSYAEFRRGVEL
ncbi:MAG: Radical domain protein, partial [Deltaproteobacteria bacterium]|nr:Radical domain protein [Deltaproteobacteria bacterium]